MIIYGHVIEKYDVITAGSSTQEVQVTLYVKSHGKYGISAYPR